MTKAPAKRIPTLVLRHQPYINLRLTADEKILLDLAAKRAGFQYTVQFVRALVERELRGEKPTIAANSAAET